MKFDLLDPSLEETAKRAVKHFRAHKNLKSIKSKIHPFSEEAWAPTFIGTSDEKISVCVEVSDNPFPISLDAFILNCKTKGYPVKCYVALPKKIDDKEFKVRLRKAQENGVGVIEIDKHQTHSFCEASALSLTGLRDETKKIPKTIRPRIETAMNTFRSGDPVKGCADVYDEIELLSRKVAKYVNTNSWWRPSTTLPVTINLDTHNWDPLMDFCLQNINFITVKSVCPYLTRQLISRIIGVIPYRNETNHPPKTIQERMTRDNKLKTRFESAVDLLIEIIESVSPAGIV